MKNAVALLQRGLSRLWSRVVVQRLINSTAGHHGYINLLASGRIIQALYYRSRP